MARPTKYTHERATVIIQAIEEGLTYEFAAALGGISGATLTRWCERYADFAERIGAAEARGVQKNLATIRAAASGDDDRPPDWRAAAWILEHRHPNQYGKTVVNNQLTGADGKELTVVFSQREDGPQ